MNKLHTLEKLVKEDGFEAIHALLLTLKPNAGVTTQGGPPAECPDGYIKDLNGNCIKDPGVGFTK